MTTMEDNLENYTTTLPFILIARSIRYLKWDLDLWLDALPKYQQLNQVTAGKQNQ